VLDLHLALLEGPLAHLNCVEDPDSLRSDLLEPRFVLQGRLDVVHVLKPYLLELLQVVFAEDSLHIVFAVGALEIGVVEGVSSHELDEFGEGWDKVLVTR